MIIQYFLIVNVAFLLICANLGKSTTERVEVYSSASDISDRSVNPIEVNKRLDWVDYVNILGGTNSQYDYSHGSTLPLITLPWAFNSYSPITDTSGSSWWFHPSHRRFYGIRVTHQPSPWINDYGNFILKASIPRVNAYNRSTDFSGYFPDKSTFKPYLFETSLIAYRTSSETMRLKFAPTTHGGVINIIFPSRDDSLNNNGYLQTRRISVELSGGQDTSSISTSLIPDVLTISGKSTSNSGGVADNFAHYFVAAIYRIVDGKERPITVYMDSQASNEGARIDFTSEDPCNKEFIIRFATSLVSLEQAVINLQREVPVSQSFLTVMQSAKDAWNQVLSRVSVEQFAKGYSKSEENDMLTILYSSLYRASIFPRQLSEHDASGLEVHWSPYDGLVHTGPLSSDSGFWDAFHTVYPLHSLINRNELGNMIQGWLNAYSEGGWLPKWSSPGYRSGMVGTMGDVVLADAIVKNIPGFNRSLAYEAIRKDAYITPSVSSSGVGRECLNDYLEHGFIPAESACDQTVSRTMNYWQSDYAIAQAGKVLGFESDYADLMKRAMKYPLLFDNKTLFFRSRGAFGSFDPLFDQYAWGGEYTEGGPWQYKFYLPFNPKGLSSLFEDNGANVCDELVKAQTIDPVFHIGMYSTEIHEETELPGNCWGQYSHNNQPAHEMLYMFGAVDSAGYRGACASKGQYYIRQAMSSLYKSNTDMFPGDEDNGEMGAWYVLSSFGLYGLNPGSPEYVFGSPLFGKVVLSLGNGKTLVVEALGNSKEAVYVSDVLWNGQPLSNSVSNGLNYDILSQGGTITFQMSEKPSFS